MIRSHSAGSRVAAYSCSQPVPAAAAARSPGLMATTSLVVGNTAVDKALLRPVVHGVSADE